MCEIFRPRGSLKTCRRGCLSLTHLLMGLKSGGYISTHFTHYNFPPFLDEHAIKDAPALWAGHSYTHSHVQSADIKIRMLGPIGVLLEDAFLKEAAM